MKIIIVLVLFACLVCTGTSFAASKKISTANKAASSDTTTNKLSVPLLEAIGNCDATAIQEYYSAGVSFDLRHSQYQYPPLIFAYRTKSANRTNECTQAYELVLNNVKNFNQTDYKGKNILTHINTAEDFRLLVGKGANLKHQDLNGQTILHDIFERYSEGQVADLISGGTSDTNFKALNFDLELNKLVKQPPEGTFNMSNVFWILKETVEKAPVINVQNVHGETALMQAVTKGYVDIAWWLLAKGADVNKRNKKGQTAYDIAMESGSGALISLTKQAKAGTLKPYPVKMTPAMK